MVEVLTLFAFLTHITIVLTYIVRVRTHVVLLMEENLSLLNKMHEGLIVVSESNKNFIRFASNPAKRLLKQKPLKENSR